MDRVDASHIMGDTLWIAEGAVVKPIGVSIVFRKMIKAAHITDMRLPSASVRGRGGAVRVKNCRADLMCVACFIALFSGDAKQIQAWKKGARAILDWAFKRMSSTAMRIMPILGMGGNAQMGISIDGIEEEELRGG